MKFGIREICDVVLKAKTAQKVGNRVFYKNEPVLYFDSLKTSSLEGASTTVYAQGGRGNARLIAWEGERTVTFTMEDALISPEGFSILTGAGLVQGEEKPVIMHTTEQTDKVTFYNGTTKVDHPTAAQIASSITSVVIELSEEPYFGQDYTWGTADASGDQIATPNVNGSEDFMYIMVMKEGNIISEPYIPLETQLTKTSSGTYKVTIKKNESYSGTAADNEISDEAYSTGSYRVNDLSAFYDGCVVFVDYYTARTTGAYQINITPDKFGGNYYLEASTLFRDTNGTDLPAEFVIPNCKIQSNFTFSMAASGDPSTFTFTMDAFPDYTRWDQTKKVFAAIQVFDVGEVGSNLDRLGTMHNNASVKDFYDVNHKPFIEL